MKIGVVSDTHDHIPNFQKAVKKFNELHVDLVIHCGDWVSPFMPFYAKELKCKLLSIFGNNDGDKHTFNNIQYKADIEFFQELLVTKQDGRKLAVYHGTHQGITQALIACGDYDAVFSGHNHTPVIETVGKTLHVNPGTCSWFRDNKVINDPSIAIYDTKTNSAKIIKL